MIALVADASRYILEAPLGDEAEPSCGVALALQLVALAVSHLLTLALAKLTQRLDVKLFFPNFCSIVSGCLAKVVNFGEFPYKQVRF